MSVTCSRRDRHWLTMLVRSASCSLLTVVWLVSACGNTHTVASRSGAGSSAAGEAGAAESDAGKGGSSGSDAGNAGEGGTVSAGGGGESGMAGAPPMACEPGCEPGVACIAGECQQCSETIGQQLDTRPVLFGRTIVVADVTGDGRLDLAYCDQNGLQLEVGTAQGFDAVPAVALPDAVNDSAIVAHGDLDGDGAEDLVVKVGKAPAPLRVFWGGATQPLATTDLGLTGDVATGDFDGDDQLDLLIYHEQMLSTVWGRANRTFEAGPDSDASESDGALRLAIADMDLDGKLDVAMASTNLLQSFMGDGTGKFAAKPSTVVSGLRDLTLSDVDQDGTLDLVMSFVSLGGDEPYTTGHVGVFRNYRGYLFAGTVIYDGGNGGPVVVGDVDSDGNPDIVANNLSQNSADVLFGIGDGSFRTRRAYGVGAYPESVAVADVDGDGAQDLVSVGRSRVIARGPGPARFAQRVYPQLEWPEQIVMQDVTDDGHPDVLSVNYWGNDLLLLAGTPSGELEEPERITHGPLNVGSASSPIVATDLDGDGRTDIAMFRSGKLTIFSRNPANHFEQRSASSWLNEATGLAAGDLNEDGNVDLVASDGRNDALRIRLGLGGGELGASTSIGVGEWPGDVHVADLNRDGHLDLIALVYGAQEVTILDGRGDGTFAEARSFGTIGSALNLQRGDLNQDGFDDLVLMYRGKISVFVSDGQGGFAPEVEYRSVSPYESSGAGGPGTALGDFDGDGRLDVAVAEENPSGGPADPRLVILRGRGDGTFLEPVRYATAVSPFAIAAADLNGDGKPEIGVLSRFGDALVVFANQSQCGD